MGAVLTSEKWRGILELLLFHGITLSDDILELNRQEQLLERESIISTEEAYA